MQNQNTNPFEPVSPEQNKANMPEIGTTPSSKKSGKIIAMIVAILAIAGSASGYFIYTLRNAAELPPSLEAVTGTGFIAGARDIGFSYEDADATLINSKTGTTTSRGKENEYFYAETDMSFYDVMMNIKADDFDTFKAQVIHYNTEDNLFYLFPGGVFKGLPGTSELKLKDSGDKYAELKNYTIPAFSPFIVFTNSDFKTFDTTAGTGTTKTYQIKSVTQSPSTYDYDVNDRAAGWHLSVLTKAKAVDAGSKCPNGVEGVWVYNPEEEDPKKMFGTSPISPSSISSTPSSYLMWINKKVAKGACRVASTQGANTGNGTEENGSAQGANTGSGTEENGSAQGANTGSGTEENGSAQGGTDETDELTDENTDEQYIGEEPIVLKVTSDKPDGAYKAGTMISIKVEFDKDVVVAGTTKPKLTLKTKDTGTSGLTYDVEYTSGSGSNTLVFDYTVLAVHNTADLNYNSTSALALNGATIKDEAVSTLNANLALPALNNANSLAGQKALVIDTIAPVKPTVAIDFEKDFSSFTISGVSEANSIVSGVLNLKINDESIEARKSITLRDGQTEYELSFTPEDFKGNQKSVQNFPLENLSLSALEISEISAIVTARDVAGNVSERESVVERLEEEEVVVEADELFPFTQITPSFDFEGVSKFEFSLPQLENVSQRYTLESSKISQVSVYESSSPTESLIINNSIVCTGDRIEQGIELVQTDSIKKLVVYFKNRHGKIAINLPEGLVRHENKISNAHVSIRPSNFFKFIEEITQTKDCAVLSNENFLDILCVKEKHFTSFNNKEKDIFIDIWKNSEVDNDTRFIEKSFTSKNQSCGDYSSLCSECVVNDIDNYFSKSTSGLPREGGIDGYKIEPSTIQKFSFP